MMQQMAKMNMRMGAPAMKFNPSNEEPDEMMNNWGMQMDSDMKMEGMDHSKMNHGMNNQQETQMEGIKQNMDHSQMGHEQDMEMKVSKSEDQMAGMNMFSEYNYDYLKAPANTVIDDNQPVRNILLNLTGNMWRYIWSMNGVPLSEADMIKISKGEKVRITFNNLTMMHHPMHLHGHFSG